ncbi:prepilin-type N-terminal cleavage/methylation domain-containing protein [bacterium]|nr:prepilin-type N-terminal cleavage/methylation domain-containing protein [bacterium]
MSNRRAFTLIELLIVVAIISILAAIAVPNFLSAQVRAKNTRAIADLRELFVAYESYYTDHQTYPPHYIRSGIPGNYTYTGNPLIHTEAQHKYLTTPSLQQGPFKDPWQVRSTTQTWIMSVYHVDTLDVEQTMIRPTSRSRATPHWKQPHVEGSGRALHLAQPRPRPGVYRSGHALRRLQRPALERQHLPLRPGRRDRLEITPSLSVALSFRPRNCHCNRITLSLSTELHCHFDREIFPLHCHFNRTTLSFRPNYTVISTEGRNLPPSTVISTELLCHFDRTTLSFRPKGEIFPPPLSFRPNYTVISTELHCHFDRREKSSPLRPAARPREQGFLPSVETTAFVGAYCRPRESPP